MSDTRGMCICVLLPHKQTNTKGEDAPSKQAEGILANVTSAWVRCEWRRCRRWPFAEGRRSHPVFVVRTKRPTSTKQQKNYKARRQEETYGMVPGRSTTYHSSVDALLRANKRTTKCESWIPQITIKCYTIFKH